MDTKVGLSIISAVLGGISVWCFGYAAGMTHSSRIDKKAIRRAEEKGAAIVEDLKAAVASK